MLAHKQLRQHLGVVVVAIDAETEHARAPISGLEEGGAVVHHPAPPDFPCGIRGIGIFAVVLKWVWGGIGVLPSC